MSLTRIAAVELTPQDVDLKTQATHKARFLGGFLRTHYNKLTISFDINAKK